MYRVTYLHCLALSAWVVSIMILFSGCSGQQFSLPPESTSLAVEAAYNNKVDILIVADRSQTMDKYRERLASEVPAMIQKLNSREIDYHIAMISMDMSSTGDGGKFIGSPRFFNSKSANLVASLQARIRESRLSSSIERGLESVQAALSSSYLNSEGAGFLRSDALLAVIAISDEDDYGTLPASSFINSLNQVKPAPEGTSKGNWLYNFIGVLSLGGNCATIEDFIDVGLRHIEMADYSNGIKASICDSSLKAAVENIDKRLIEVLSERFLSRRPVVESIQVLVNGEVIPRSNQNGWEYFAETNSIRFFGSFQPNPNDVITVNFTPIEGL